MKFSKVVFVLFFLLTSIFVFADESSKTSEIDSALQKELVMSMSKQAVNLNPITAAYNFEAQIINGLYEGLFSYNSKTLEPTPALCESYKISKDKKRWTFTLKKDIKFSDGTPITAQTIKDSWIKLLSTPQAPYASLLDCIVNACEFRTGKAKENDLGIKVKNDSTLIVNLTAPTAHFSRLLCHHSFAVTKEDFSAYSGAYILDSKTENEIRLVKNQNYWDAKNVHIPSIKIVLSDDEVENTWLFNTGRTDWIVSFVDSNKILNKNSLRISAIFGTSFYFFSCKNKPWDNAELRNALLQAVPWKELRSPFLIPATTLIYPLSGYKSPEGLTETNEDEALEMMEDARKKLNIPKDEKLKLIFAISKESDIQKKEAELLKTAWEKLGVELVIQTTTDSRYIDSIPSWDADIFYYGWIGDYPDPTAFLELFRSGSTLKETKWQSKKFDELITKSSETIDSQERYKLLSQAESILLDEGVILPLSHSLSLHALDLNTIGGWYTNALDIHPFKDLYFKENNVSQVPNIAVLK